MTWSVLTGDALMKVIRFPAKLYLRIVTPLARFGGFAPMPSTAMTREITPGLRYQDCATNLVPEVL